MQGPAGGHGLVQDQAKGARRAALDQGGEAAGLLGLLLEGRAVEGRLI